MGTRKQNQKQYYKTFSDDLIENKGQAFTLPKEYVWIRSACLYKAAQAFSFFYCRLLLHVTDGMTVVDSLSKTVHKQIKVTLM